MLDLLTRTWPQWGPLFRFFRQVSCVLQPVFATGSLLDFTEGQPDTLALTQSAQTWHT